MSSAEPPAPEGTPGPAGNNAPDPAPPPAADAEYRCDLCGAPMLEWHCRIICNFCGYQRDCSDP
jgi:hypothetical protein